MVIFKLAFALLGYQLALFLGQSLAAGLVVGGLVGHVLDVIAIQRFHQWRTTRILSTRAKKAFDEQFFASLFGMLGMICRADGAVSKSEIVALKRVMNDMLELDRAGKERAKNVFRSSAKPTESFQKHAYTYFEIYQHKPEVLENTLRMFFEVAQADGEINEKEEHQIQTAASIFGINKVRYEQLRGQQASAQGIHLPRESLKSSYRVLGCDPLDPVPKIKKRYRELVREFHPDTIHAKELSEEFTKFAERRFNDIQSAYEAVRNQRGF